MIESETSKETKSQSGCPSRYEREKCVKSKQNLRSSSLALQCAVIIREVNIRGKSKKKVKLNKILILLVLFLRV